MEDDFIYHYDKEEFGWGYGLKGEEFVIGKKKANNKREGGNLDSKPSSLASIRMLAKENS